MSPKKNIDGVNNEAMNDPMGQVIDDMLEEFANEEVKFEEVDLEELKFEPADRFVAVPV